MPVSTPSNGIDLMWSWCAHCERAYETGTCRLIPFAADSLHPHPTTLHLCPYSDCSASTLRDGWRWATIQHEYPEYPLQPERNVVYPRGENANLQAMALLGCRKPHFFQQLLALHVPIGPFLPTPYNWIKHTQSPLFCEVDTTHTMPLG